MRFLPIQLYFRSHVKYLPIEKPTHFIAIVPILMEWFCCDNSYACIALGHGQVKQ